MKQFLAIYIGKASSFDKWHALDEAEREKREASGMQAWMEWMQKHASMECLPIPGM